MSANHICNNIFMEELTKEFDKLQTKYGSKNLDSVLSKKYG